MPKIGLAWWALLLGLLWGGAASAQQCTQSQLNTEFMTDPTARTYQACAADGNLAGPNVDDACVLQRFNTPCTDNAACKVPNMLTREQILQTIIDPADLEKLARSTVANDVARKSELDWLLQGTAWDMSKAHNQQLWKNVFTSNDSPTTNGNINNAQLKDAPRSQIVCGRPGTLSDVSCGLRGAGCS
jgi:hypothetical protein